jgi:CDP-glycerol glycerophosphotransferase
VVFQSRQGLEYSGNPRAIYEELRRSAPGYHVTWVYSGKPDDFPDDVHLTKRDSWAYYRALARAQFWVDDEGFPPHMSKRDGTTYIQAWHQSPYERLGFHDPAANRLTAEAQRPLQAAVDRYDAFLVRSSYDVRTLVPALRLNAELLPVGYPRNDVLVRGADAARIAALRQLLGLTNRRVFLYAPVIRSGTVERGVQVYAVPFDLSRFAEQYGDEAVLVVRPPANMHLTVPPSIREKVRDAANITDVPALMLTSDVLVTDHSPLMFDYVLLDRPMIFHQPADDEGPPEAHRAYFDLAAVAPGPMTRNDDELLAALGDLGTLQTRYADVRRRFLAEFAEYDTGHAAEAVVARFFAPEGRHG